MMRGLPTPTMDVSVVVTNYDTGSLLDGCVRSFVEQELEGLALEVIVVDDASPSDQARWLEGVRRLGARVLALAKNVGHGAACNRGLEVAAGRCVLFVNSDVVACPGAIVPLVRFLDAHHDVAFVEPRTFLDDDRAFLIPELVTPSPHEHTVAALSRVSARAAMRLRRRHLRRSLASWRASEPIEQPHLTGACFGARRQTLRQLGAYDERYPLFYEDSDLFVRARRQGLRLVMLPAAHAIHYGHRSVAPFWEEAIAKSRIGRARYIGLHHGRLASAWDRALERLAGLAARVRMPRPHPVPIDLGEVRDAPCFELPAAQRPMLLLLAIDPWFLLACGHIEPTPPPAWTPSQGTWGSLFPTRWFLGAFDLDTLAPRVTWTFVRR